jgi:parvulin-like peptidyl-prolyl isomerase
MSRRSLVLILLTLGLAVPTGAAAAVPADAIALVAGEPIARASFDQLMHRAECSFRSQGRAFPELGTDAFRQLRDSAVAFLVQRVEFAQKASQLGIAVSVDAVEQRLDAIKKEFYNSEEEYQKQLRAACLDETTVRVEVRNQLMGERLFETVTSGVTVSDSELSAHYRANLTKFRQRERRVVRHIMVRTRAVAERLYARIRAGESFAKLARQYSTDVGTRRNGGRLTIERGETVRNFDRVAFSLRRHEISRPFRTQYGWHVVQALSNVHAARTRPFKEVRDEIRELLLTARKNAAFRQFVDQLRAEYADKLEYAAGFVPGSP